MKPLVVGIVGALNSGKGVAADVLVNRHQFILMGVTDHVKSIVHEVFDIPWDVLLGPSDQRRDSIREMLQTLGTDWARRFDEEIWIKKLRERIQHWEKRGMDPLGLVDPFQQPAELFPRIVVPDVRFFNEVKFLSEELNAHIIHIRRPDYGEGVAEHSKQHETELAAHSLPFTGPHFINTPILNDSSQEDLEAAIDTLGKGLVNDHAAS